MNINEYILSCANKTFEWGKFDCCIFATGAVKIITGIDCMKDVPKYHDETTANIMLKEYFNSSNLFQMYECICKKYKNKIIDKGVCNSGDIALVKWPHASYGRGRVDQRVGFGVYHNNKIFVCVQPRGLVKLPFTHRVIEIRRFL